MPEQPQAPTAPAVAPLCVHHIRNSLLPLPLARSEARRGWIQKKRRPLHPPDLHAYPFHPCCGGWRQILGGQSWSLPPESKTGLRPRPSRYRGSFRSLSQTPGDQLAAAWAEEGMRAVLSLEGVCWPEPHQLAEGLEDAPSMLGGWVLLRALTFWAQLGIVSSRGHWLY